MTPEQKSELIRKLAAIEREGRLSDLRIDFTAECRKQFGGLPTDEWRQREARYSIDANTSAIGQAAAQLYGGEASDWQRDADLELSRDKYSEIADGLVEQHAPTPTPQPSNSSVRRRAW
jgi:hypothetical protein